MNLVATIAGTARSPLISGSSIILRRPVSSASLVLDDEDGSISIGLLDEIYVEIGEDITEDSGLPGAMLPGAWLPGGGTPSHSAATRIFEGFVSAVDIEPAGKPGQRRLKLECLDWNWRLDNPPAYLTKAYSATTDQAIILDALTELGLTDITADSGTVAAIATGLTVAFEGATMRDVLDELTKVSGAIWWVDGKTLSYNSAASAAAAPWDVDTDAPDDSATYDVEKMQVQSRHDYPLNSVVVVGPLVDGERATATANDATSISAIGTYRKRLEIKSVSTTAYAQDVADQLVAAGKDARQTVRFGFHDSKGQSPLTVNQKIEVTSARFGLSSQAFVTREVRISQRKGSVSEFSVEAGDFRPTVTDLLRRLEAAAKTSGVGARKIRGLDFASGSGEYVASGTSIPLIDDLSDFSIFATIEVDSVSSIRTICAKEDVSGLGWRFQITTTGALQVTRTRASTDYQYTRIIPGGFVAGKTYRIVVTSAAASPGTRFWVNGTEATTLGGSGLGSGDFDSEASSPFYVGRRGTGVYHDGFIGAVALWNIALPVTTAQKVHNMAFDALPFAANLGLAWALDEFLETTAASGVDAIRDRSGNNYNGTPANTPTGDSVVFISD